jgi:carbonic anhydrase
MNLLRIYLATALTMFGLVAFAAEEQKIAVPIKYLAGITMTQSVQAGITPNQAIEILKEGNQRFLAGKPIVRNEKKLIYHTALGQFPFASVIACIDSRSAPEIVFDQNIGDLFVARVAGNVANDDIIGSLEFASKVAGSKAIVVLGHTNCGAVKGACDNVELGNLTGLLAKIKPAVNASKVAGQRNSKNYEFVDDVTEINVAETIKTIRGKSPTLREMEQEGKIKIVGGVYDISNGQIIWQ